MSCFIFGISHSAGVAPPHTFDALDSLHEHGNLVVERAVRRLNSVIHLGYDLTCAGRRTEEDLIDAVGTPLSMMWGNR
jgi:hypothetical protein